MTILKELFRFGTLYFSVKLLLLPNFPPTFPFINNCYYNQTYHFRKIVIMLNVSPDPKLTEKSHLNSAQFVNYISSEPDFTSRRPVRKKIANFREIDGLWTYYEWKEDTYNCCYYYCIFVLIYTFTVGV